jgi:squalene synthase HpnC
VVIDAAYARCLYLAHQHYENFPVASRLLPRAARPHVAAVYAFARLADDFADEGSRTPTARLALLDDWSRRLDEAAAGSVANDRSDAAAIFIALSDTMQRFELERSLFDDLLSAFRQDVTVRQYDSWAELRDYCRRSANPVGRLVLRITRHRDADLDRLSDHVCTALQLTNFWQDLETDTRHGRLYVPMEVVRATGAEPADLQHRRFTPAWRQALALAENETRHEFDAGRAIADRVRGRLRWELRATWLGGTRILDRLAAVGFDVFKSRPTLGWADAVLIGWRALGWRRTVDPAASMSAEER